VPNASDAYSSWGEQAWCPALAATQAGQGPDRGPRFSGDLRNFPVLRLDIGLGVQVSFDLAEFRARHFAVRDARPILVENIEEASTATRETQSIL
jgi:hypothetical protein